MIKKRTAWGREPQPRWENCFPNSNQNQMNPTTLEESNQAFWTGLPPLANPGQYNEFEARLAKIERQLNRLETRINQLETQATPTNNDYDAATNMYMV